MLSHRMLLMLVTFSGNFCPFQYCQPGICRVQRHRAHQDDGELPDTRGLGLQEPGVGQDEDAGHREP